MEPDDELDGATFDIDEACLVEQQMREEAATTAPFVEGLDAADEDMDGNEVGDTETTRASRVLVQQTLPFQPMDVPIEDMSMLRRRKWDDAVIDDCMYVPKLGQTFNGKKFAPVPNADIIAINVGCARGKSTATHTYVIDEALAKDANARTLLMSANIIYGTSLYEDLKRKYEGNDAVKIGFYREVADLDKYNVVICSLESLQRLEGQQFDYVLPDEFRTIARLVGGGTMKDFENIFIMKNLCIDAKEIIIADADMNFKVDDSEPTTLAYDYAKLVFGARRVVNWTLSRPPPSHLMRRVRLFFSSVPDESNPRRTDKRKSSRIGKDAFWAEIDKSIVVWHTDHSKRFAVCCGSKTQLREVYTRMVRRGVPAKPYSGDTSEKSKHYDLKDPDTAWLQYGCIAATTSLSIGVDPKHIQFDRVFIMTHKQGCTILATLQAAMRFGRPLGAPLGDMVICVLLHCMPPSIQETLIANGKRKATSRPTYESVYKTLVDRRAATVRGATRELNALGARPRWSENNRHVPDTILRVMAHGLLERRMQLVDHYATVMRCFDHYGWGVEPESRVDAADEVTGTRVGAGSSGALVDEDDLFAAGYKVVEKCQWAIEQILDQGEDDFFDSQCNGLAIKNDDPRVTEKEGLLMKTGKDLFLVDVYWILKPIQRVPHSDDGPDGDENAQAKQLEALTKKGVLNGLNYNAHARCMQTREVQARDALRRMDPDKAIMPHPLLHPSVGMRMDAIDRLARVIGVERLYVACDLPTDIVNIARRETIGMSTDDDAVVRKQIHALLRELGNAPDKDTEIVNLLRSAAVVCGMTLEGAKSEQKERIVHPTATAGCGKIRIVTWLRFECKFEDIVDDWHIRSDRLGYSVPVAEWHSAHRLVEDEDCVAAMRNDPELDETLFSQPHAVIESDGDVRHECVDGAALTSELHKLNASTSSKRGEWYEWLVSADTNATAIAGGRRVLTVVYNRHGVGGTIGHRVASPPSLQSCPAGLKQRLIESIYHDACIVDLRPRLMLQVCMQMNVDEDAVAPLVAYKNDRESVLETIGAHYGVASEKAWFAVLHVLGGGSIVSWTNAQSTMCARGMDTPHEFLRELEETARVARDAVFKLERFRELVPAMRRALRAKAKERVASAQAEVEAADSTQKRESAQNALGDARRKATPVAIERSMLLTCLFQLEDEILATVDESLKNGGWTVASLHEDGMLVEHRPSDRMNADGTVWEQLNLALHIAQVAVKTINGYDVELAERPLYKKPVSA
jgi:hypothetical protein